MYRGLETANVLNCRTVRLNSFHVLIENGKDLVVEDLVLSDAVSHFLQGLKNKGMESDMLDSILLCSLLSSFCTYVILCSNVHYIFFIV